MVDVGIDEESSDNTTDEEVFKEQENRLYACPLDKQMNFNKGYSIGRKMINIILRKYWYPMYKEIILILQLILKRVTSLK